MRLVLSLSVKKDFYVLLQGKVVGSLGCILVLLIVMLLESLDLRECHAKLLRENISRIIAKNINK